MSVTGQRFRLPGGGRIDREQPLRFTFDGRHYTGCRGDTLASALLANGVHAPARSVVYGRPRGILTAGAEEPNALVQVEGACAEPMLPATTVELRDRLAATSLAGEGRLPSTPDPALYDKMNAHCDVLVVGAGPAGLAAALAAGRSGARVILADEGSEFGGSLLGTRDTLDGVPATEWIAGVAGELAGLAEVNLLPRTTVVGYYDHDYLLALQRRTDHLDTPPAEVARQRLWHIRARRVVLATGAHERPLVFARNDLPGTMLAGAARTYLNRYAVLPGHQAVVFTTNDSAYPAALDLAGAGVEIAAVAEARPQAPEPWAGRCAELGIPVLAGHHVVGTSGGTGGGGGTRICAARVAAAGPQEEGGTDFDCDLLLISGGWNPAAALYGQSGDPLGFDERVGAFVPRHGAEERPAQQHRAVTGAATGARTLGACLRGGAAAGAEAATLAGFPVTPAATPRADDGPSPAAPELLWCVPHPGEGEPWKTHFVDLARDATVADIRRAIEAGMRSVEHVKRLTTIGTGPDQGKTSSTTATGIVAETLGTSVAELGTTASRPPYTPVTFGAFAGRDVGRLFDPARVTAIHPWHAARGAVFEDVGQWKRPWYFPRAGEDLETAVARECRAARERVALMDVSTLGKIDVQGPDAGEFLDRVYTNRLSTLPVGKIRYAVMCTCDGMVFDDGTVARLDGDRFFVTTTTGNAAAVLAWFEEWLQTEWTDLRVYCTSVTDHWATVAVAGPCSRRVIARVAPGLAADGESFPFMTSRGATVAGVPARVGRVSFSGELAYEVNVAAWHGPAVWQAIVEAGEPYGITPYGTEAMHVLRAEKGFVIVGQETDGQVTPLDLGLDWAVSKKKEHFLGKRSLARPALTRPDRRQLVGLLPVNAAALLPEGAQLIGTPAVPEPPVPMLGHVTSSYYSAALGRTFALALVRSGRDRLGETVYAPVGDRVLAATVTEPVFYDKESTRRDGDTSAPLRTCPSDRVPGGDGLTDTAANAAAARRASPLEHLADRLAAGSDELRLREVPFPAQVNLRTDPEGAGAAQAAAALGTPLPVEPNTVTGSGQLRVLWLGPDEWLVVGPDGSQEGLADRLREAVERPGDAGASVAPVASVVDVSAERTVIEVAGPRAREVLAKGCSLDLHPRAFGPGQCAQTLLARTGVILLTREAGEPTFWVFVRSTFADYAAEWLLDARREYPVVHPDAWSGVSGAPPAGSKA